MTTTAPERSYGRARDGLRPVRARIVDPDKPPKA